MTAPKRKRKLDPWIEIMLTAVATEVLKTKPWATDGNTVPEVLKEMKRTHAPTDALALKRALIKAGVKFPKRPK